jgi:hypothetical protein
MVGADIVAMRYDASEFSRPASEPAIEPGQIDVVSRLPSGSKNDDRRAQPANSRQTILQNHLADSTIDNTQNIFTWT